MNKDINRHDFRRFIRLLPLIAGIFSAFIWAGVYFLLVKFHGMQGMFARQNHGMIGSLIASASGSTSLPVQIMMSALDALIFGFIFGWIVQKVFFRNI